MLRISLGLRRRLVGVVAVVAGALATPISARADFASYYVGVDDLPTIATGTYAGLPNPNHNRLTLLYAHTYEDTPASNHYHSKAVQIYTGPNTGATTAVTTSTSNYVPEGANPPIKLTTGAGVYAGKHASNPYTNPADPTYHFSFLEMRATNSLDGFATGTGENTLFKSGSERWNTPIVNGADVHLELVSLTPGLKVGTTGSLLSGLVNPGDERHLGGGNFPSFTPVLYTESNAAPGFYVARFKLTDESNTYGESGVFEIRTEVVPEPGTLALLPFASLMALARRRRRRRRAVAIA